MDVAQLGELERHNRALEVQSLLDEAREQTGLTDFGKDQSFLIGLRHLVQAMEAINPSPYLRADTRLRIVSLLVTRLRMVEDARLHPEILDVRIEKPLIIAGLPRTGTTISFDLLSLDPAARYPREWEWLMPWPATEAATIDTDPRIDIIQQLSDRVIQTAPGLAAVHRFDVRAPGECNSGMMHHFSSANYFAELGANDHGEWLIRELPAGQYADHKRLLQQMHWKGPAGRWLLKSPQHLFNLPDLFATYPDARMVWTHRDPVSTFSSLSSFITMVQHAVKLDPDPHMMGDIVSRIWTRALLNAVEAVEKNPALAKKIVNLPHREIVKDPIDAMRQVYAYFGEDFSPEFERRLANFTQHDEKAKRAGLHKHRPEDFGIDPDRVRRELAPYYERFGDLVR